MSVIASPQPMQQRRKMFVVRPQTAGLKMDQDTVTTDPHYCVVDSNWNFYNGETRKRPGQTAINASVLGSASTYIMGTHRFRLEDGTVSQIACTPTRVYSLNSSGVATDRTSTVFTGGNTDLFTYCVANDEVIITNGVDTMRRWDGVTATESAISGSGAPSAAKYVESYIDRIFAARTTESGTLYPRRVRWSNNASNTTWNGTSAGFADLNDSEGWIIGIRRLKEAIVVYKEDSIIVGRSTGIASAPVTFNQRAGAHGCISGHTVADVGNFHIFLGRDNVYLFDLVEPIPIGDPIREELFSTTDFDKMQYSHAFIKDDRREYWLWVTPTGESVPTRAWCYNWKDQTWSRHSWSAGIISSGRYASGDTITWDDITDTWDSYASRWDDSTSLAFTPYIALGGTVGVLYYMNTSAASDAGTAIDASLETGDIDFGLPGYYKTITAIRVMNHNIGQTNMSLAYSTNGASFTEATTTYTPGTDRHSTVSAFPIATGEQFRFRIRNSQAAAAAFIALEVDYVQRGRV